MKYIDAELLRKEIEFAKSIYDNHKRVVHGVADAFRQDGRAAMCDDILKKIDSLQKEQPELPDNLDEAAEEYEDWVESYSQSDFPTCVSFRQAFKAGAEWQAKQGYSLEYIIQYACGVSDTSTESKKATLSFPLPADIIEGDRVIIQIRKNETQPII